MNQSTEGGKVTAYFDGKELKKITGSYYGETFRLTEECYFYKNKPIFFYTIRNHYKVPINVDSHALVDSTFEDRYYFNGDNIIKYSCSPQRRLSSIMLNNAVKEASREAMRLTKLLNGNVR